LVGCGRRESPEILVHTVNPLITTPEPQPTPAPPCGCACCCGRDETGIAVSACPLCGEPLSDVSTCPCGPRMFACRKCPDGMVYCQ
jgi:hypothetical protein